MTAGLPSIAKGQQHRDAMAARSRRLQAAVAEIGPIPDIANPDRRASCQRDLCRFLTTYFPATTGASAFSEDHLAIIARMQRCGLHGGHNLNVIYRGAGKTTISENTVLWLTLYGHRRFVSLFAMNLKLSSESIDAIKMELSENDLLLADFPEVCVPIHALEGKPQRCKSQTCGGKLTHLVFRADTIVYPTIEGSVASGAVVMARPFKKARGIKFRRPDGQQSRPDFAIVDDPQDIESATSPASVQKNLAILQRDICQSGGHRRRASAIVNATVIERGDMIDVLLADPAWQGERVAMVKSWASRHDKDWLGQYADLRRNYDRTNPEDQRRAHEAATDFYRKHRTRMDRGCVVSWEACYDPDTEISAIQHAYNILIDYGPETFAAECQNQPMTDTDRDEELLPSAQIATKVNGLPQRQVPAQHNHLTAFVDVHKKLLYWMLVAWSDSFDGAIIDYGVYPRQSKPYFTLSEARKSMAVVHRGHGVEGAIYAGLETLTDEILTRDYIRDDGAALRVERCLIDSGWGPMTDLIYQFCRQSVHATVLMPSKGQSVRAGHVPMTEYKRKPSEKVGFNWVIGRAKGSRAVRLVRFDTNYWKSFIHARLSTPIADRGSLSLFGPKGTDHRLLADSSPSRISRTDKRARPDC